VIVELPIRQEGPYFGFSTELDGVSYGLTFRWNDRVEQWVMDVADGEGTVIVAGIRVVIDTPLLLRYQGRASVPPGEIIAVDTGGKSAESDLEAIGRRVVLYYLSVEEFA
jgi:hypothetical protein